MQLRNREELLCQLAEALKERAGPEHTPHIQRGRFDTVTLANIKVTFYEDEEELTDVGLAYAVEILVQSLWQTGDGTDISEADSLEVDTY